MTFYSLVIDQLRHNVRSYSCTGMQLSTEKDNVCGNFEISLVRVNQSTKSDDFSQSITDSIYVENFDIRGPNQ